MNKAYKPVIIVFLLVVIFYVIGIIFTGKRLEFVDENYHQQFLKGNSFYTPLENGLPWEINVVYNDIFNLAEKNNLVFFGSSTTREGIIPSQLKLPKSWKLTYLSIGDDTIDSFWIMLNYLNSQGNHKLNKTDVAVVHVWYTNFAIRPQETNYSKRILELFGFYTVDDALQVRGGMTVPGKEWKVLNYKMKLAASELFLDGIASEFGPNLETTRLMFRNFFRLLKVDVTKDEIKMTDPELLEAYKSSWAKYMGNASFPGESTDKFKHFLSALKAQTNVVVVNQYTPSWHLSYSKEKEYETWLHAELLPFLKEQGIPWFDFSRVIPDEDYGDSSHLFKKGRERYTRLFNDVLPGILGLTDDSAQ